MRNDLVTRPRCDIFEKEDSVVLLADMPGVADNSIEIEFEAGELTIVGRVDDGLDGLEPSYTEFRPGAYRRTFRLSDDIDAGKIEASLKNGVLRLQLPKKEAARPRKIPVAAS